MYRLITLTTVALLSSSAVSIADDFPPGSEHDIVASVCTQCHDAKQVTTARKSSGQWAETVRQMIAGGAKVQDADFDKVVSYLARNFGPPISAGGTAATRPARFGRGSAKDDSFAAYQTVEGQPIQIHPPEGVGQQPAFLAQTRAPYHATAPYKVTTLAEGLNSPWGLAFLPNGNILISERLPGAIRILTKNGVLSAPLAGLSAVSAMPEFCIFDVALDPHFDTNHRIFFTFCEIVPTGPGERSTDSNTYLARATLDEAAGTLRNIKVIFRSIPAIPTKRLGLKTGGRIAIASDGSLFVTIGDRNDNGVRPWTVAQDLGNHLGKVIHVTPDGKPAPGNPLIGKAGALPEIWSYGNRSEEGLAFDPKTGMLWETEHGPRGGDELNVIKKGLNYGWPVIAYGIDYGGKPIENEGTKKAGMEQPVYYWDPVIAPSGLAFYHGALFPEWKNSIFVGGLRGMLLTRLTLADGKVVGEEPLLTELHTAIRDVRVGPDGAVYVLTQSGANNDKLLKLSPK